MTFNEAQAEFAVRYYRWARGEFRREIEQGFPVLKRLKTRPSSLCLHWMAKLTPENQLKFGDGLAKRFRKEALQSTGEGLDDWQKALIKRYTDSTVSIPHPRGDLPDISAAALRLRRKNMATLLKSHLAPVFNQEPKNLGGGTWRYTNAIAELQLETHLDFGGRSRLVEYSHNIVFSGYQLLVQFASVESWLGLAGGTSWSHLDVDDSEAEGTAQLIAELCAHFLEVAPGLVDGLSP
jgi:hypothetical protein